MSRVLRVFVLIVALVACAPLLGGSRTDPYFSEWQRIEAVREVAEASRQAEGTYPATLGEICVRSETNAWPCDAAGDPTVPDIWGNDIWYEPAEDGYRIGSPGPDGVRGTPDDLGVDAAHELDRVSELAGCYRVELPGSAEPPPRRLLVLDTVRAQLLRSEWRAAAPSPRDFSPPKWHPWRHDSVLVVWAEVRSAVDLRFAVRPDSLVGVVHSPTGIGSWWDVRLPARVAAVRVPCAEIGAR